jgi:hypothetical protein
VEYLVPAGLVTKLMTAGFDDIHLEKTPFGLLVRAAWLIGSQIIHFGLYEMELMLIKGHNKLYTVTQCQSSNADSCGLRAFQLTT